MANNEVVEPVLNQEEDPVTVNPAENENDEQEDQEQEIEQEIEQAENEDVFEDTLEEQPHTKPPIPQPKVKLPNLPVPTFSAYQKEDVTVFFDQLENIAEIYGWSDRLTLETALASLKANVHAWAMELDHSQKRDYKKFKSLTIETFKKSVPSWLRSKKMLEVQQHPGQDSQDFAATLRKVQLTLQAPSDAMLSAYLCGLEGKLAQMVAMHDPQSFEEAVRMAKKFEAIVTSSNEYSSRKCSNGTGITMTKAKPGMVRATAGHSSGRKTGDQLSMKCIRGTPHNSQKTTDRSAIRLYTVHTMVNVPTRHQNVDSSKDSRDRVL